MEKLPISKDAIHSPMLIKNLAHIYVMVGAFDLAINKLEYLLYIPGGLSKPLLKLDPAWNPIRNHSRFKKLIEPDK